MDHNDIASGGLWEKPPGSIDPLNSFMQPKKRWAFPHIKAENGLEPPKRLLQYKDWAKVKPGDGLHFFIDDYRFEHLWNHPGKYVGRLVDADCVLSPDFSLFSDWNVHLQTWNTYRSRWCGAFWQSLGIKVIPSISWGGESTFGFCFQGVDEGSMVAISAVGTKNTPQEFSRGLDAMVEAIRPSKIICYGDIRPSYRGKKLLSNLVIYPFKFKMFRGSKTVHKSLTSAPSED